MTLKNSKRIVVVYSPGSTRASGYAKVRTKVIDIANSDNLGFKEIRLNDVFYLTACNLIKKELKSGDIVLAAGGDGTAQVAFDAAYSSNKAVVYGTIPLGNGNDVSRSINRGRRHLVDILNQPAKDFYPLNIYVNNQRYFSLISYLTFGATTVLVDYINRETARQKRRVLRTLSPAVSLPINKINKISYEISNLEFPDFYRSKNIMTEDSVGFFIVSAAHNLLKVPKRLVSSSSQFFFHYATTKNKNLGQKIIMAGKWSIKFPGELSDIEELKFINKSNITANIAGDNVDLKDVNNIMAIRGQRPIKVLMSN